MRLVGGVVGFVEDECAKGVDTRGSEVGEGTVDAEPRGKGDEVVVGWREVVSTGDIMGDEIVLLLIAGGIIVKVRDVEEALDDAIEGVGIGSGQGSDVGGDALLVG